MLSCMLMSICVCERVIVCVNAGCFISAINICMFTPDNLCSTAVFHRGAVPGWRYTCTHIHTQTHTHAHRYLPLHILKYVVIYSHTLCNCVCQLNLYKPQRLYQRGLGCEAVLPAGAQLEGKHTHTHTHWSPR